MPIGWGPYLRSCAPVILLVVVNLLLGIYALGHANGKRDLLVAATVAAKEAKG